MRRFAPAVLVPFAVAAVGATGMLFAVRHYERSTGHEFYRLAGYHYSMPEWGFAYHLGGERIEDWTVTYPVAATTVLLLVSATVFTIRERRHSRRIVGVLIAHVMVAVAFIVFAAFVSLNVTGVFI